MAEQEKPVKYHIDIILEAAAHGASEDRVEAAVEATLSRHLPYGNVRVQRVVVTELREPE